MWVSGRLTILTSVFLNSSEKSPAYPQPLMSWRFHPGDIHKLIGMEPWSIMWKLVRMGAGCGAPLGRAETS